MQGHDEALELVNVHRKAAGGSHSASQDVNRAHGTELTKGHKKDNEIQRAKDLVDLHYGFKTKYAEQGLDSDLRSSRQDVHRICQQLSNKS